jgi:NDP-sugar pyrophosphorylase family protein
MKAMILAAGFGTRLRPLSDRRPKPLMPVANRPVILRNMEYLRAHGVMEIVVNTHHHAAQLTDFLRLHHPPGMRVDVRVEPQILGTGGGIRNTADFWGKDPFIVINGDVLTDLDITKAYDHHLRTRPLATLILHDQPPYNKIRVDEGRVLDIPKSYGKDGLAFTGIHIMDPEILNYIPEGFSDIVDCYRNLIGSGKDIGCFVSRGHHWCDIGNLPDYFRANRDLAYGPFTLGPASVMHPAAKWKDWAVVGEKCRIEEGAEISRSILWEEVCVSAGVKVKDCVVTSGCIVEKDCSGAVL